MTTHETFQEHIELRTATDRGFGLTVGGILAAIGLAKWLLFSGLTWGALAFLSAGAVLVGAGLAAPRLLAPLNRLWTKLGLVLFKVVNPLVMLLLFAAVIVPAGLLLRLFGHDPLRRKRDPAAPSYWIERQPPGPAPETMVNQF